MMSSQKKQKASVVLFGFSDIRKKSDKLRTGTCRVCGKTVSDAISTTSNFLRHFRKHPANYEKFLQSQQAEEGTGAPYSRGTGAADPMEVTPKCYLPSHPKQKKIVTSTVRDLIVGCSLPLSLVERPQFRRYNTVLDPKYRPMTRSMVCQETERQYAKAKKGVIALLAKADDVAITLDICSEGSMRGFLAVTAHAILDFELKTRLLACQRLLGRHTGENVFQVFGNICTSFKVKDKIRYVVTGSMTKSFAADFPHEEASPPALLHQNVAEDDAGCHCSDSEGSSSTTLHSSDYWEDADEEVVACLVQQAGGSADRAKHWRRLACFARTLELCVADGLKEAKMSTTLAKVYKTCNLLHTSTVFEDAFERRFGPDAPIPQVTSARWTSTLQHINTFLQLDEEQVTQVLDDVKQTSLKPSAREYGQLKELSQVLQPFQEATAAVQAEKGVTISAVVPSVVGLYYHLQHLQPVHLSTMVAVLRRSLETRFGGILAMAGLLPPLPLPQSQGEKALPFGDYIYFIAAALDPNFYFLWLQKVSDNEEDTDAVKEKVLCELKRFCSTLRKTRAGLLSSPRQSSSGGPEAACEGSAPPGKKACVQSSLFAYYRPSSRKSSASTRLDWGAEMRTYSALVMKSWEERTGPVDVLRFWGRHQEQLKLLSAAALSVFLVPASSAPVERVFSEGGVVMRPHRARLLASRVEKIVFLKCNQDTVEC